MPLTLRLLCGVLILTPFLSTAAVAADPPAKSASLKDWRRPAVERRRRIIFDNDGNEPLVTIHHPDADEFLKARTKGLVGSQVDTIFYGTNACFGTASRDTKAWSVFSVRAEPHTHNQTAEMIAAGLDPLKVMIDFGHKHNMEVFSAVRMNDVHDKDDAGYPLVRWANNPFKNEHPDLLLGSREKRPKRGGWTAVSFDSPIVRDSMFAFVAEAIQNYDIDGLHLDFFRHPVFFRSTAKEQPATAEETAMMTELITRIRRLADETGKKRGRPILLSVRVPDSVEYSRAIGLDIETWLANDLIDLLSGSSYFQLNEWKSLADLGHRYGVRVFPSLDESRVKEPAANKLRMSTESYRGRAANVWQAGCDGVLLFNAFDPSDPGWRELGDANLLKTLNRDYVASVRGVVSANGGNLPYTSYQKIETLNPANPKAVAPGKPASAILMVGEKLDAQSASAATLLVRFEKGTTEKTVAVTFNGQPLTLRPANDGYLTTNLPLASVNEGRNEVSVSAVGDHKATWIDLALQVQAR